MKHVISRVVVALLIVLMITPAWGYSDENLDFDFSQIAVSDGNTQYMEKMIKYYIQAERSLQEQLKNGFPVVFAFEGASQYAEENPLTDRRAAYVVVVKFEEENSLRIVCEVPDCSTIPDAALHPIGKDSIGNQEYATTIKDGVYGLYTCNHLGQYAGLNVRMEDPNSFGSGGTSVFQGVYLGLDGAVEREASCINIHTRRGYEPLAHSGRENYARSLGCQLVSTAGGGYNSFIEALTGHSNAYNVCISNTDIYVGAYVVDRYCYRTQMLGLYNASQETVDLITSFSVSAVDKEYLSHFDQMSVDGAVAIVSDETPIYYLPDSSTTPIAIANADSHFRIIDQIQSPDGTKWYCISTATGRGYVLHNSVSALKAKEESSEREAYLAKCNGGLCYLEQKEMTVIAESAVIRSLPCVTKTSLASYPLKEVKQGDVLTVTGHLFNQAGNKWAEVLMPDGQTGYIFFEHIS